MTDTPKPLTSAELADLKAMIDVCPDFVISKLTILRLIDMIEQRDVALNEIALAGENGLPPDYNSWLQFHERIAHMAREALAAQLAEAQQENTRMKSDIRVGMAAETWTRVAKAEAAAASAREDKDQAYLQRNHLVAMLARLYPSGIRATNIPGWSPDWQGCVYIDLPSGQISYHYHDSQAHLFSDLPPYTKEWDGHDKNTVHARLKSTPAPATRAQAPAEADGWRPIETAPKDGTPVLVAGGTLHFHDDSTFPYEENATSVSIGRWQTSRGCFTGWMGEALEGHDNFIEHRPTHWQPLPAPPSEALAVTEPVNDKR